MRAANRRRTWRVLGGLVSLLFAAATVIMFSIWPALGTPAKGDRLARMEASPQYRDGKFANTLPTLRDGANVATVWEFFTGGSDYRTPGQALPVVRRTAEDFAEPSDSLRVTWLGHSTLIVEIEGARILVDPVWGERVSPSSLFGPKRFYSPPLALSDLPPIDAVVLSHDHYDHLDEPTIRALASRIPRFLAPLGIGAHLEGWGVAAGQIEEFDWWEETTVEGAHGAVRLVATPARHFSGRSVRDRDATLWCGWAFVGARERVFYSGDSALTPEFADIGERLGPFDLTLIEAGAYDARWADIHMGPEQAVETHRMVRGGLMVPIHWGLFDLALHGWTEPGERIRAAAETAGVRVAYPKPGESIALGEAQPLPWWPEVPWKTALEKPVASSGLLAPAEVNAAPSPR